MNKQSQYLSNKDQSIKQIILNYYQQIKSHVNKEQITVSALFSLTNDVYSITTKNQCLLLKIYQPSLQEFTDNLLERLIVCKLADRGLYPSILYFNPQLRIQQFMNSTTIEQNNLGKDKLFSIIHKLADFACQYVDFVKEYNAQKNIGNKYGLDNLRQIFEKIYQTKKLECPQLIKQAKQDIESIFYNESILSKLQQILKTTPLVLSHNDCHLGNVLFSCKGELIVDFQFCQFNFIGYDLGNFLNEWATQYSSIFQIRQQAEMEEEQVKQIIHIYFNKISTIYNCGQSMTRWIYYTKLGRVLSHFFWMIIGLKQINHSKIAFSMVYYIKRRKEQFLKHFNQLLSMSKQ